MDNYQVITSKENRIFKLLKGLYLPKGRKTTGLFVAEGYRLVRDLSAAGLTPEIVVYADSFISSPQGRHLAELLTPEQQYVFAETLFNKLAETVNPQGVIAAFRIPEQSAARLWHTGPKGKSYVLCLDRLQDPGNLGTIIRTCSAFGYALVLGRGCVDLYNPKVVRASMGELGRVPILSDVDLIAFLRSAPADLPVIVTSPHGERSLLEVDTAEGCILVIGNEAQGVSPEVEKICGRSFYIPTIGQAESLNAAVATALAIFQTVRAHL